jgi:hypothetical protein
MKEKFLRFSKKLNLPAFCLLALVLKSIMFGTDIALALTALALSGVYAYNLFLNKDSLIKVQNYEKDITDIKNAINGLKINQTIKKTYEPTNQQQQQTKRFF